MRMHYWHKAKERNRLALLIRSIAGKPVTPMESCIIEVVRYSTGLPDWDGLYGGLKLLLDCLVVKTDRNPSGLGFIVDDNPMVLKMLTARPVKCTRREQRTEIVIVELPA